MDATGRQPARTWLLRELQSQALDAGFSKADMDAAVAAVDDWATANAISYNAALPQPFRGGASASMKALLLAAICLRRAGLARTSED